MITTLRQYGTLIGLLLITLFFAVQLPDTFLTARNFLNISQQVSMLAVTAFSMTVVMVMNDFDLSVGSMASLSGVVAALMFVAEFPIALAVLTALGVGFLGGLFNGMLVSLLGILPFIATLGTLTIFSGLAFFLSDGRTIFGADIPTAFSGIARSGVPLDSIGLEGLTLPTLTITALCVLAAIWLVLEHTTYGRRLYAIGGNIEAARLAGLRITALRMSAFAIAGVGAALAGLMYASRVASANPTQGSGLMLDAIAAVFLGMTMGRQGEPRVQATLVGVLILGILDNGLTKMSIDSYIREMLIGALVLAAVATSSLGRR